MLMCALGVIVGILALVGLGYLIELGVVAYHGLRRILRRVLRRSRPDQ